MPSVLPNVALKSIPTVGQRKRTSQSAATEQSQGKPQKEETDQVKELRSSASERLLENAQPATSSTSPVPVLADSAAISDNTIYYPQLFANADESTRATLSWANEYLNGSRRCGMDASLRQMAHSLHYRRLPETTEETEAI